MKDNSGMHSERARCAARLVVFGLLVSLGCATQEGVVAPDGYRFPTTRAELRSVFATSGELEEFLRTAEVTQMERLGTGITQPYRITLVRGDIKLRASWKTVDVFSRLERFADGTHEMNFRDSYRHEIAAYELDKLLGLSMVPPAVERSVRGKRGCAQLWIEGARTLTDVIESGREDLHVEPWTSKLRTVRLFHQLVSDSDWKNNDNTLVDGDGSVYVIDSSRAFRLGEELVAHDSVKRFSRSLLDRLRALTPQLLDATLRRWLSEDRISSLLARRDLILRRAEALAEQYGEAAVLVP